ncbi:MAG: type IV pilus modification protein PilV [Methylophaga sp.]|nr:type IV pilus modification protein PilV [Methylophaga sp.]
MNFKIRSRGFSLIEVMVALLVLALGILGISKLQGTLIRNSSDANQRAVATSIAQEKIDDLRSFANVKSADTWSESTDSSALTVNQLAFNHIENNEGGAPAGTVDLLANKVITRGNANYTLTWEVEDYVFDTPMSAASLASSTVTGDLKLVNVNVAWFDEMGEQQTVSLSTFIDARNPGLIALSGASKEGGEPPVGEYTPEAAPDVINVQVDTGGNKFRQTSKPLPDAISQGQDANTVVTFEVVTYSTYNGPIADLDFVADTIEEYVTVDCKCQFSASNSVSRTAAHVRWNPDTNSRYDYPGDLVSKETATPTGNVNAVDELCTTCCRDHHDVNDATKPVYVPGTTGGNHLHYQEDGSVASQANGDTYIESCRMKRIDGIYRVFQDWNLYDLTVIERGELADGGALQSPYSNYIEDFVLDFIIDPDTAVKPSARSPVSLTEGAGAQLQSRGVFIDNVYDDTGSVNPTDFTNYVSSAANADRVDKIPFAEVNLTLLSDWSSSDTSKVTVTNEAVATIPDSAVDYYGLYSRGFILALDEADPDPLVTSVMRRDNDGLTQQTNRPSPGVQTDGVDIDISAGAGPITLTFSFDGITYPSAREGTPELNITGGGVCNPEEASDAFTCFVTAPWTGTAQITVEVTSGPQAGRCTGQSTVYSASSLSSDTTHNFGIIDCN